MNPRDGLVPHLTPHVRAAAGAGVEPVLRGERAEIEAEPARVRWDGHVDALAGRRLREEQDDVTVVRRAALRVRGDIARVCGREGDGGRGEGGEGEVRPGDGERDATKARGAQWDLLHPVQVGGEGLVLRVRYICGQSEKRSFLEHGTYPDLP